MAIWNSLNSELPERLCWELWDRLLAHGENVGNDCHIERAILDKDCRVGNNVTINYRGKEPMVDGDCFCIRDGIVVIPKGMVVPDGKVI